MFYIFKLLHQLKIGRNEPLGRLLPNRCSLLYRNYNTEKKKGLMPPTPYVHCEIASISSSNTLNDPIAWSELESSLRACIMNCRNDLLGSSLVKFTEKKTERYTWEPLSQIVNSSKICLWLNNFPSCTYPALQFARDNPADGIKWVWGADRKIHSIPSVRHHEACQVMLNSDPEEQIFLSVPNRNSHDRFSCISFSLNINTF